VLNLVHVVKRISGVRETHIRDERSHVIITVLDYSFPLRIPNHTGCVRSCAPTPGTKRESIRFANSLPTLASSTNIYLKIFMKLWKERRSKLQEMIKTKNVEIM